MKKRKIPWNKIDSALSRLSHISQILLVALAIFGFFYTVLPLYENQLLNEQISEKEIELRNLNKELESTKTSLNLFTNLKNETKTKLDSLIIVFNDTTKILSEENSLLHNYISNSKNQLSEVRSNIRQLSLFDFLERIERTALRNELKRINSNPYQTANSWISDYRRELKNSVIDAINQSYGYGLDYGINRIPDSLRIKFEEISISVLKRNYELFFIDYSIQNLKKNFKYLSDSYTIIDTLKIKSDLKILQQKINEESNPEKKSNLIKEVDDLNKKLMLRPLALLDAMTRIQEDISKLILKGLSELKDYLIKEL